MSNPLDPNSVTGEIDPRHVVSQSSMQYKKRGMTVERMDIPKSEVPPAPPLQERRLPPTSKYLTTGLPSGCRFYGISDNSIGVRRFSADDVLKIYDARADKSLRMLAETVGATLNGISVWDLTVGDFWFLMYWHRINSYPRSPFVVTWVCENPTHIQQVKEDQLSVETLSQNMVVKSGDLQVRELDATALEVTLSTITMDYQVHASPMRMGEYLKLVEMEEEVEIAREKGEKPKYKPSDFVLARHAAHLEEEHGKTLEQRMEFLRTGPDFSLWAYLDAVATQSDHGVDEKYHVKCKHCGAPTEVEVALDALTFLPEL